MQELENRMVVDAEWRLLESHIPDETMQKLNGAGYEEIGSGIFVPEKDAYAYAMERISLDKDLQKELVEWFYSGNWIKEG